MRTGNNRLVRKLLPWAAVAAVLAGIIFGWNALVSTRLLPSNWRINMCRKIFKHLPVTMGNKEDSLQAGLAFIQ